MATLTTAGVTFGDSTVQTTAAVTKNVQAQLFTASDTWVCPPGVTSVQATVIGGGGGGGAGSNDGGGGVGTGGRGGYGGMAVGYYTVAPGTSYTITVGTGGAGSNSGAGSAGASSSFASFCSATAGAGGAAATLSNNGANGADGAGTNGTTGNYNVSSGASPFIGRVTRARATSSTAALVFSATINFIPGAGGEGEVNVSGNNAAGGVGGAILLEYVG
jgi:hypothetical protein